MKIEIFDYEKGTWVLRFTSYAFALQYSRSAAANRNIMQATYALLIFPAPPLKSHRETAESNFNNIFYLTKYI